MATDTGRMHVKMEADVTDVRVVILQTVWLQALKHALREPYASSLEDFATPSEASLFCPENLQATPAVTLKFLPPPFATSSRPTPLIPRHK